APQKGKHLSTHPLSRASLEKALVASKSVMESPWNPFAKTTRGLFANRGSNNWVVAPSKTKNGHAIVCNDPHLSLNAPPVWYPVHLNTARAGGKLDVVGVSIPGDPAIVLGGNGHVGWAFTNTNPDTTDVYVEQYSIGTGSNGNDQVMWDPDGVA